MTTPPRARVYSKKKNGGNCKISENTREDRDEDRDEDRKRIFVRIPRQKNSLFYPQITPRWFTLTFSALRESIFLFFHFRSPFFHSCFPIKGKGGKGRVTISSRSFRNEKDILIELTLLPFRFPLSGGSIKNFHRLNRGLIYCGRLLSVQIPGKKGVARTREGRRSRFVRRILSRHRGSLNPPHDSRRYFIHRESRGFNFTPFYDTLPCLRFVITFDAGKRAWPPPPFRGKEKKKKHVAAPSLRSIVSIRTIVRLAVHVTFRFQTEARNKSESLNVKGFPKDISARLFKSLWTKKRFPSGRMGG